MNKCLCSQTANSFRAETVLFSESSPAPGAAPDTLHRLKEQCRANTRCWNAHWFLSARCLPAGAMPGTWHHTVAVSADQHQTACPPPPAPSRRVALAGSLPLWASFLVCKMEMIRGLQSGVSAGTKELIKRLGLHLAPSKH